jgi:hypothetical protein
VPLRMRLQLQKNRNRASGADPRPRRLGEPRLHRPCLIAAARGAAQVEMDRRLFRRQIQRVEEEIEEVAARARHRGAGSRSHRQTESQAADGARGGLD